MSRNNPEVIASFNAGRDNQGYKRTVRWVELDEHVTLQLLSKNKEDTRINWNKDILNKLFESFMEVKSVLNDENSSFVDPTSDLDTNQKVDLMSELANSMTEDEVERFRDNARDDVAAIFTEAFGESEPSMVTRDDVEKTKEMVLQDIYEEFGFESFTAREFKELYNYKYEKSTYNIYLQRLSRNWLRRQQIDGKERYGNGDINYEYELSKSAEDVINKYGSFLDKDYPVWNRKRNMLPEHRRPE